MNPLAAITLIQVLRSGAGSGELGSGAGIAIIGMVTVFAGLLALAFLLPMLEKWVANGDRRRSGKDDAASVAAKVPTRLVPEELAAVSAAIHAHLCFLDQVENMKLTWEDHDKPYSPWRLAGKAEHLQGTESLQNRNRSR